MEEEMEELYVEGLATCDGPESCADVREGGGEALTGVRIGRVIEPRNDGFGVLTLSKVRKAILSTAFSRAVGGPCAVLDPGHVRNLHAREPGDPMFAQPVGCRVGRPGNAEAVILG
jgi:hypothetical protein